MFSVHLPGWKSHLGLKTPVNTSNWKIINFENWILLTFHLNSRVTKTFIGYFSFFDCARLFILKHNFLEGEKGKICCYSFPNSYL